jgi:hypothetical protein
VLALTLLFTGLTDQPGELSRDRLELIKDLVTPGARWLDWCEDLLNRDYIPASSALELARQSFRWLLLVSQFRRGRLNRALARLPCRADRARAWP